MTTQGYPVPNADYVHSVRIVVPVFNALAPLPRTSRLPSLEVLDDMVLLVKAWPLNPAGSIVFVAETSGYAVNPDVSWPLTRNETASFRVKNASSLVVTATVALCWVTICTEQRGR